MKLDSPIAITGIRVRNVLGARDIDVKVTTPATLICGFNAAGKSSIQESLRLAFQATTVRVEQKKHYPLMVTEGAKEGYVRVDTVAGPYEYQLPTGAHSTAPAQGITDAQLNAVLDAQRFASMTEDERRAFLTVLTKARPSTEKLRQLLAEAGVAPHRIELCIPMLRSGPNQQGGFPAAHKLAGAKATEAKGAWKQVAGSTWYPAKSAAWEPPPAEPVTDEEMAEVTDDVEAAIQQLSAAQQSLGGLLERQQNAQARAAEIEAAQRKVNDLPRLREKLERDQAELATYTAELDSLRERAGEAPRVGLVHDMATFIHSTDWIANADEGALAQAAGLIEQYEAEHGAIAAEGDPDAASQIPAVQKSVELMQRAVENGKREVTAAETAEGLLTNLVAIEPVDAEALAAAQAAVTAAQQAESAARRREAELRQRAGAAAKRSEVIAAAKTHHEDVLGWQQIAEQFAPDGIPSQILAKALAPLNAELREASIKTGWPQVAIAPDMTITAGGRLYSLHSEAERWMLDAQIAAAISKLAGLHLLVLDRFDVLDVQHRPELVYWLDDLADEGMQSFVFGTLKEMPKGLPDSFRAVWITGGEMEENGLLEAA